MKGLILKDFINLKKNIKIFSVLIIIYGVMSFASEDAGLFSSTLTILFAVLVMSLYSYDEMAKWDGYALTMPLSRDTIVQGKYLMMLLLTLIGAIVGLSFTFVMNIVSENSISMMDSLLNSGIGASIIIFFYSIAIPFITKLGIEKARMIVMVIYLIPFILTITIKKAIESGNVIMPENMTNMINYVIEHAYFILPVVVLLALCISYTISIRIYRKKEF